MLAGMMMLASITAVTPPQAPVRYKIDLKTSQEVDLSAMGGPKQVSDMTASAWVTVTMSDTAGGKLAHLVIDSLVATPTGMMAQQMTDEAIAEAKGAFFHLYVVNGKVSGTPKPSIESPVLGMVQQSLSLLFPGHKMGAKVGDTWSDTTKSDTSNEGGSQTGTTVTEWKVLSLAGDGYVMEGESKGSMTATQGGGELNIATKMTGTQKVTTSASGPSSVGENTMKIDATVITSQVPDPIPVTGSTMVMITLLP